MKNIFAITLIIALFGCGKDFEQNGLKDFNVTSYSHTGCLTSKSTTIDMDVESYLIHAVGDDEYFIEHKNVSYNCCLPEGIECMVYAENDTIFVSDKEKVKGTCKCLCQYNTVSEVEGIKSGDYILCFTSGEECLGSIELSFNATMNKEVKISDLN